MNIQTPSRNKLLRLLFTLLGILALTTSTGLGAMPDRAHSPLALVRVDFQVPSDLQRFAATGLPVYAQLQTTQGSSYLLLPATQEQQNLLSSLGFAVRVLDEDAGAAGMGYYLLYARDPGQIRQASRSVTVLDQDGRQGIAKAAPEQAERLGALGMEYVRLKLHPLATPQERPISLPEVIDPDPVIQGMIDQVDSQTVYDYDAGLSGEFPVMIGGDPYTIATRYTYTTEPIQKATQYTYEHFQALGLPVYYHTYTLGGIKRNVIAEQPGVSQPERIFLVTAHLDSITNVDPEHFAPGADDNASGSTGVLIAADILSQYSFDCTIRYALFTGEEQGLVGSEAYADYVASLGEDIEGVLNLDMIGYNTLNSPPVMELHTRYNNQSDLVIANWFVDVIDAYNLSLTPQIVQDGISASDHYSFWQVGYPAILGIEDFQDFTPYYHEEGDLVETLDMGYFTNFVKAAVGTMAHMGCLLNQGTLMGQVTDAVPPNMPVPSAEVAAERSTGQDYSTQTGPDGNYLLNLDSGTYTVTAQAEGYIPYITSGIEITTDVTTTLNIQLQPCVLSNPGFTFTPENPLSGEPITFTGSVDPTSTEPVEYDWEFGDGHTGSGQVATHTYTVSNTYTVTMTATNCAGTVTASHPVSVTGVPGISVSMQPWDVDASYGETLTKTLEIGNSGEQALTWSLTEQPEAPWLEASSTSGDLDPQERQEITLTLQAPLEHGIYTTTLQVQSNDPDQPQIDIPVTLDVACTAAAGLDFTFSPATPHIGETVVFSGGVITGSLPISYTWEFQDGSEPVSLQDDPSVEHIFPIQHTVQTYGVNLVAENFCSAALFTEHAVTVYPNQVFLPLLRAEAP